MGIDLIAKNVDPGLLKTQLQWLEIVQDRDCAGGSPSWDGLEGIINLIGAMLDQYEEEEVESKIELIHDENGKTIGQRKFQHDRPQQIRLLDAHGEYDNWEDEKFMHPDEPNQDSGLDNDFLADMAAKTMNEEFDTQEQTKAILKAGFERQEIYNKAMQDKEEAEKALEELEYKEVEKIVKDTMMAHAVSPEMDAGIDEALAKDLRSPITPGVYDPEKLLRDGMIDSGTYDKLVAHLERRAELSKATIQEPTPDEAYMHTPGAKDDEAKPMSALVLGGFSGALQEVIKVGTFGAIKYSPNGWMHVPNAHDRYSNAAMRHWLKRMDGETFNFEDGNVRHLAQVIWNLCAVLEFELAEDQIQQVESQ